jgi:hypothetical protein
MPLYKFIEIKHCCDWVDPAFNDISSLTFCYVKFGSSEFADSFFLATVQFATEMSKLYVYDKSANANEGKFPLRHEHSFLEVLDFVSSIGFEIGDPMLRADTSISHVSNLHYLCKQNVSMY